MSDTHDAIEAEYGRFTARHTLDIDGLHVFRGGDPVSSADPRLGPGPWGRGWIADKAVTDRYPDRPLPHWPTPLTVEVAKVRALSEGPDLDPAEGRDDDEVGEPEDALNVPGEWTRQAE